jgi:hypothetical protein
VSDKVQATIRFQFSFNSRMHKICETNFSCKNPGGQAPLVFTYRSVQEPEKIHLDKLSVDTLDSTVERTDVCEITAS